MSAAMTELPVAGLIRRLMALVYDSLLLLGVTFAYGAIITIIRMSILGRDELDYVNIPFIIHIGSWLLLWAILAGYYVVCWLKRGQTLGMKSWRLQLVTASGEPLSAAVAWKRRIFALISTLPAGLGYLWMLIDKNNGCWHDNWTKTRIVVLPKKSSTGTTTPTTL